MTLPTIGVPGYAYPPWTEWLSGGHTEVVIMNPNSGPASTVDSNYTAAISAAHAVGTKVIAYVSTGYGPGSTSTWYYPGGTAGGIGGKPLGQVLSEIDTYKAQYPNLDGVFFDEASTNCANTGYYSTVAAYARSVGLGWIAINPGVHPPACYDGVANAIMVAETTPAAYLAQPAVGWEMTAASKMWHVVYGAACTQITEIAAHAVAAGADLLYVTDDVLSNPWDNPPAVACWNALLAGTAQLAPATSTVPNMTVTANVAQVVAGQHVVWTIVVTNSLTAVSNFVGRIDDAIPAHITARVTSVVASGSASYTPEVANLPQGVMTIPPGGRVEFTVNDTCDPSATGVVTNQAVLSVSGSPIITRTTTVPIVASSTVSQATLTKTPASPTVAPGGTVTWTLTIANPIGAPTATGRLVDNPFSTVVSTGRTTLMAVYGGATFTPDSSGPIGSYSIPAGGSVVWTIYDVIASAASDQTLTGTAVLIPTTGTGSSITVNPTVDVRSPVAAVVMTFENPPPQAWADEDVDWTLSLSNPSPAHVTGRISCWRPPFSTSRSVVSVARSGNATFVSESADALSGNVTLPPGASIVWHLRDHVWVFVPEGAQMTVDAQFIRAAGASICTATVYVHRRVTPPPTPCPCT